MFNDTNIPRVDLVNTVNMQPNPDASVYYYRPGLLHNGGLYYGLYPQPVLNQQYVEQDYNQRTLQTSADAVTSSTQGSVDLSRSDFEGEFPSRAERDVFKDFMPPTEFHDNNFVVSGSSQASSQSLQQNIQWQPALSNCAIPSIPITLKCKRSGSDELFETIVFVPESTAYYYQAGSQQPQQNMQQQQVLSSYAVPPMQVQHQSSGLAFNNNMPPVYSYPQVDFKPLPQTMFNSNYYIQPSGGYAQLSGYVQPEMPPQEMPANPVFQQTSTAVADDQNASKDELFAEPKNSSPTAAASTSSISSLSVQSVVHTCGADLKVHVYGDPQMSSQPPQQTILNSNHLTQLSGSVQPKMQHQKMVANSAVQKAFTAVSASANVLSARDAAAASKNTKTKPDRKRRRTTKKCFFSYHEWITKEYTKVFHSSKEGKKGSFSYYKMRSKIKKRKCQRKIFFCGDQNIMRASLQKGIANNPDIPDYILDNIKQTHSLKEPMSEENATFGYVCVNKIEAGGNREYREDLDVLSALEKLKSGKMKRSYFDKNFIAICKIDLKEDVYKDVKISCAVMRNARTHDGHIWVTVKSLCKFRKNLNQETPSALSDDKGASQDEALSELDDSSSDSADDQSASQDELSAEPENSSSTSIAPTYSLSVQSGVNTCDADSSDGSFEKNEACQQHYLRKRRHSSRNEGMALPGNHVTAVAGSENSYPPPLQEENLQPITVSGLPYSYAHSKISGLVANNIFSQTSVSAVSTSSQASSQTASLTQKSSSGTTQAGMFARRPRGSTPAASTSSTSSMRTSVEISRDDVIKPLKK